MKKILAATAILVTALALSGCGELEEGARLSIDQRYALCVEAGGTWEYNGSLPYWACYMPGFEKK